MIGTSKVDFTDMDLTKLKELAKKNKRKMFKQGYLELAVEIANKAIENLDSEDFENVFNLKLQP
jgi:hypothetical protein